jgi:hypothetical protein
LNPVKVAVGRWAPLRTEGNDAHGDGRIRPDRELREGG